MSSAPRTAPVRRRAVSALRGASPLQAHLGFWLRLVSNHVSGRFAAAMAAQGLSVSEWVVLRALYDGEHSSHAALIAALGMTKGAASKVLSRLEAKALATRAPADDSAKTQLLSLTPAGRALVPRLAALADDNDAQCFGHLDDAQRGQLRALLQDLARHHGLDAVPTD